MTRNRLSQINIVTAILWASAIIAAAILKAPNILTIVLLPMLAMSSLIGIRAIGRRALVGRPSDSGPGYCR